MNGNYINLHVCLGIYMKNFLLFMDSIDVYSAVIIAKFIFSTIAPNIILQPMCIPICAYTIVLSFQEVTLKAGAFLSTL